MILFLFNNSSKDYSVYITDFKKKYLHTLEPLIFKLNYTFSPHFTTRFHHPTPTFMYSSKGHTQNPPQQQGQCRRGHGAGAVVGALLPLFALLRGVLAIEGSDSKLARDSSLITLGAGSVHRSLPSNNSSWPVFFWPTQLEKIDEQVEIKKSVPQVLGLKFCPKLFCFFLHHLVNRLFGA